MIGLPCEMRLVCNGDPADSADHDPPLSRHQHIEGTGCCRLRPGCRACQGKQARQLAGETARFKKYGLRPPEQTRTNTDPLPPSRDWA